MRTTATPFVVRHSLAGRIVHLDWLVLVLVATIASVGVAALYSTAGGRFDPWAGRHALRACAGLVLMLCVGLVPFRVWLRGAYPFYLAVLVALVAVPFFGVAQMGARRWLGSGDLSVQPAELMKVALVLALARYYQWLNPSRVSHPLWVAFPLVAIAVPVAFVLKQPDLGTAVLVLATGIGVMFLAGVRPAYFVAGAASSIALGNFVWPHLQDYQRRRLITFLDPDRDPLGAGYHIAQSKIALGAGGLKGRGFLGGTQAQLNFLPEKQTDFIFTMFAEETGFAGALVLMALYAALIASLIWMALRARHQFARLLASGMAVVIALHVTVNIAMVIGLLPVVGVPLPFVSYGGTSLLTLMFGIGLALSARLSARERLRRDEFGAMF